MRRASATAAAFAAPLALLAALAGPAAAEIIAWGPPARVQEAMERDHVAGLFLFELPQATLLPGREQNRPVGSDPTTEALHRALGEPAFVQMVVKSKIACCKISTSDEGFRKLAEEFGADSGMGSVLVVVSFDREVLCTVSQIAKPADLAMIVKDANAANKVRVKASEDASAELSQVERWLDERKYADAARRVKAVLDKAEKERKIAKKVIERAKALDEKVEAAGKARLAEGKALLDAGKPAEARPILEEIAAAFGRFACGREARRLLAGAK